VKLYLYCVKRGKWFKSHTHTGGVRDICHVLPSIPPPPNSPLSLTSHAINDEQQQVNRDFAHPVHRALSEADCDLVNAESCQVRELQEVSENALWDTFKKIHNVL
jgi:hypothetical protein